MNTPRPLRALLVRPQVRKMYLALAFAGTALLIARLATDGGGGFATVATVGVLMAVWSRRARPVQVYDGHLELKAAPLASRKLIRFEDISSIDQANAKKVSLLVHAAGKQRPEKIRLPLHLLSTDDRDWLLDHLETHVAAA